MDNDTKEENQTTTINFKADLISLINESLRGDHLDSIENNYLNKDKHIQELMYSFHSLKIEMEALKAQANKPKVIPRPWSDFNTSLMSTSTTGRTTNRSISRSKVEPKKNESDKLNKNLLTSPKVSINLDKSNTNKRLNTSVSSIKRNNSNMKNSSHKKPPLSIRDNLSKSDVKKQLNFNFSSTNGEMHHRFSFKFEPKKKSTNFNNNDKSPFPMYHTEDNVIRSNIYSSSKSIIQSYSNDKLFHFINEKSNYKAHCKIFDFLDIRTNLKNINHNLRISFMGYCLNRIREMKEKGFPTNKESSDLSDILELEILSHKEDVIDSYIKRININ